MLTTFVTKVEVVWELPYQVKCQLCLNQNLLEKCSIENFNQMNQNWFWLKWLVPIEHGLSDYSVHRKKRPVIISYYHSFQEQELQLELGKIIAKAKTAKGQLGGQHLSLGGY